MEANLWIWIVSAGCCGDSGRGKKKCFDYISDWAVSGPHSAQEMAEEFGVSVQVIAGIIGAAQRWLAQEGLTASDLREAARDATEATALRPLVEPGRRSHCTHSLHRSRAR